VMISWFQFKPLFQMQRVPLHHGSGEGRGGAPPPGHIRLHKLADLIKDSDPVGLYMLNSVINPYKLNSVINP
jgi:hypothetical protein